jgi:putative sterol carrier protein
MTSQEFFSRLGRLGTVPDLAGVRATYRYEIYGAGVWRVIVQGGRIEVAQGRGRADGTLFADASDFSEIVSGRRNLVTALMQARVSFEGSVEHLVKQPVLLGLKDALEKLGGEPRTVQP